MKILVGLALLIAIPSIALSQSPADSNGGRVSLSVNDSRPLAQMLDKVQHLYISPIGFEEVPYQSSVDLKTTPIKQINGSTIMFFSPPVVDFNVTLGPGQLSSYDLAQSVLSQYASTGLPGTYNVVQAGDQVNVIPYQVRSASGDMIDVTPLMSTPVEFPLETRSVLDTLQLVVQSISARTGAKVILLNVPFSFTDNVTMNATGEAARDVIVHLGKIFGTPETSQCLYNATFKTYYLNVEAIFAPNPPGVPIVPGYHLIRPLPGPNSRSPNSPLFTKQP